MTYSLSKTGVEWVALERATASNSSGDDKLVVRVDVDQLVDIAKVASRVLVSGLEACVVVLDDGVEEVGEGGVRLRVRGVHTAAGVQVLHTCRDWSKIVISN